MVPKNSLLDDRDQDQSAAETIRPDFLGTHDDLGVTDEQRAAEIDALNSSFYQPDADDLGDEEAAAASGLTASKGEQAEAGKADKLYRGDDGKQKPKGKRFGSKKSKWLAGGIGGGIAGVGLFGLFSLPAQIMHMMENTEKTFFSSVEDSAERMSTRLLAGYIAQHVMPGLEGACTSTRNVNKSCAVVSDDDGPVARLYRVWRDYNLEGQLADKFNFEIRRDEGRYMLLVDGDDIFSGESDANMKDLRFVNDKLYLELDRREVRQRFLQSLENETYFKRMMYRFKYGRMMERRYGVVRCLIACDYRNDRADRKEMRKIRWKAWFVDRVITPRNEAMGLAWKCALGGFNCADEGSYQTNENGERQSQFETDVRSAIGSAIGDGRMTSERLGELTGQVEDMRTKGFAAYYLDNLMAKIGLKGASKAIPIVGQIDLLVQIAKAVENVGPAVKTMNYVLGSAAFVQMYMMYRTTADEIKTGQGNAEDLGYVSESLGPNAGDGQGGGSAASSVYYQDIMGTSRTTSLFPKTYAATGENCNEGSVATGLCPEMHMTPMSLASKGTDIMSDVYKYAVRYNPAMSFGIGIDAWKFASDKIFGAIGGLIDAVVPDGLISGAIPDAWEDMAAEIAEGVAGWFGSVLFNNPFGDSKTGPSGARNFESAAVGANIAANDYAHYGLGAGKISDGAANDIRYARLQDEQRQFSEKSFFAKVFDGSDSRSAVSKLALSLPSGGYQPQQVASSIINPFGTLSLSIGLQKAEAAPIKNLDYAGVTQYGYLPNDPIFQVKDYQKYWVDNNCDDTAGQEKWAESAAIDDKTGMPVNTGSYPCKLIESIATVNCGYISDECLTPEELNGGESGGLSTGANFRAAAFNILHYPDGDWQARLKKSVATIKGNGTDGNGIDVIALQEVRPQQMSLLKNNEHLGDTYEIWPNATERPAFEPNVIAWRKDRFDAISRDFITIKYFGGQNEKIPLIKFEDKSTGQQFYFVSTHDPADAHGDASHLRKENADTYARYFNNLSQTDPTPVVLAGDFNSGYSLRTGNNATFGNERKNLTYCILTRDGPFWNTYDAVKEYEGSKTNSYDPRKPCPTDKGLNPVDHIYISKNINATKYISLEKGHGNNGSDHPTIISDIEIPGAADSGAEFTIGTYNLPSKRGYGPTDWQKAVDVIKNESIDVVGFQEMSGKGKNTEYMRSNLSGYASYPDWNIDGYGCANSTPIFYDTSVFTLKKSELLRFPQYKYSTDCGQGGKIQLGESQAPILWLEYKSTGQQIIVMNTHNAADGFGGIGEQGARIRNEAAQIYLDKIVALRRYSPDTPIFFTGDFNEGFGVRNTGNNTLGSNENNLFFCMITKDSIMKITEAPKKTCNGRGGGIGGVDYIYVTSEVEIEWHKSIQGRENNGSDHPRTPHYAHVIVKSKEGTGGTVKMGDDYAIGCEKIQASGSPGLACSGQCVDFVKFRLKKHIDKNKFAQIGNGNEVAAKLGRDYGYTVDKNPGLNSVVSWPPGGVPGSSAHDTAGHTAMVSKVVPKQYIIVEEYNYSTPSGYGTRRIPWNIATQLTYAHTEKAAR